MKEHLSMEYDMDCPFDSFFFKRVFAQSFRKISNKLIKFTNNKNAGSINIIEK